MAIHQGFADLSDTVGFGVLVGKPQERNLSGRRIRFGVNAFLESAIILLGDEESQMKDATVAAYADIELQFDCAWVVVDEATYSVGMSLTKTVDTLVVIACDEQFDASCFEVSNDREVTTIQILVLVDKQVLERGIEGEIASLFECFLQLVYEFRAKRVSVDTAVLAPESQEARIRKARFPINIFRSQALPVGG